MKKQVLAPLLRVDRLGGGMFLHVYQDAEIASAARPGQFVNVRVSGASAPLLRRPLSICWADSDQGEFAVLFKVVGEGTEALGRAGKGDAIDVVGPLGSAFHWEGVEKALLVGGGVGVAPLYFLAHEIRHKAAAESAPHVTFAYGARDARGLALADRISDTVDEFIVATEDGSVGKKGFVTAALADHLRLGTHVFCCGPTPMMAAVLKLMRASGIESGQFSLENQMGCAMGVCMGCVVPTRQGYMRVCHEGPVLPAGILDFDQMQSLSAP